VVKGVCAKLTLHSILSLGVCVYSLLVPQPPFSDLQVSPSVGQRRVNEKTKKKISTPNILIPRNIIFFFSLKKEKVLM